MATKTIIIEPAKPAVYKTVEVSPAKPAVTKDVEVGPGYILIYKMKGGYWQEPQLWARNDGGPKDIDGRDAGSMYPMPGSYLGVGEKSYAHEAWLYIPADVTPEAVLSALNAVQVLK